MSHNEGNETVLLAPNGCPLEHLPEDPTRLFSSNGLTLDLPRIGWIGAGICTLLATIISFVLIYRHLQYYTKPNQQRHIVRMLLMVPIYAITSWFSFVYVREAVYYDKIRILYEAFVISSFLILMLQYLGDSLEDQKRVLRRHKKTERWFFPLCCMKYNPSRPHFLQYMKWGILQYVPLNVLATVLTIILQIQGSYCESSWNPKFGHVWILVIQTTAVTISTYFLIMFYFTVREDLKEYSPFYKFMSVKLVVFFSFWQMVAVEGLVYFGYIKETTYWSTTDIAVGINAILIDIEMVFFAIMHLKAFSYKPYVPLIINPELPEEKKQALLLANDANDNDNNNNSSPKEKSIKSKEKGSHKEIDVDIDKDLEALKNNSLGPIDSTSNPTDGNKKKKGNHDRLQNQSLASIRSDRRREPSSNLTPSSSFRRPPPGADPRPGTDPTVKRSKSKKSNNKEGKMKGKKDDEDEELPEMIMDRTQKTPIWKGLLDSFNPLDTIRELAYGVKYMYRWSRGIPVDKDSRRLLDLERAFGRTRPEVPYIPPPKDEKAKKNKKKKNKDKNKKTKNNQVGESDTESTSGSEDEDFDYDDEKGDKDGKHNKDESYDRGSNRVKDHGEKEKENGSRKENASVSRYRQFPDDFNRNERPTTQRRGDTTYDIGHSNGSNSRPTDSMRSAGGVGMAGSGGGRSPVTRKPVKPVTGFISGNAAKDKSIISSTSNASLNQGGRPGQSKQQQQQPSSSPAKKKKSVEYLGKEEAARTERATLPDIQPEPVERKVLLSGLYVDMPPLPVEIEDDDDNDTHRNPLTEESSSRSSSSLDIPVPRMNYQDRHHHPLQDRSFRKHQHHTGYDMHDPRVQEYEAWRRKGDGDTNPQPSILKFQHRDHELERAAAVPYVLPVPAVPLSTRPNVGPMMSGDPYQRERDLDRAESSAVAINIPDDDHQAITERPALAIATQTEPLPRDHRYSRPRTEEKPTIVAIHYDDRPAVAAALGHGRIASGDAGAATIRSERDFYHHQRDASRSDPELSRYRNLGYEGDERSDEVESYYEEQDLCHIRQQSSQGPRVTPKATAPQQALASEPTLVPTSTVAIATAPITTSAPTPGSAPVTDLTPPVPAFDDVDPIVAQYNQLQYKQKLEEHQHLQEKQQQQQQKQQQEKKLLQPQQKRQERHEGSRPQRHRPQLQPPLHREARQYAPPPIRRRNSLESLSSDNSGGFRVRAIAGAYDRRHHAYVYGGYGGYDGYDRYGYGYGYNDGHDRYGRRDEFRGRDREREKDRGRYRDEHYERYRPSSPTSSTTSRFTDTRYEHAYRHPLPLSQPVQPLQFYRFPEERELYEQRRRELQHQQEQQTSQRGHEQGTGYGSNPSMRQSTTISSNARPLRDHERSYQLSRQQDQQQQQRDQRTQRKPNTSSFYDDLSQYTIPQRPAGASHPAKSSQARGIIPLPTQMPNASHMMPLPIPMPIYPSQPQPARRSTMDYAQPDPSNYHGGGRVDAGMDGLFPASRYAAPFLRDYELQQREGRRQMARSPPIDGPSSFNTRQMTEGGSRY